MKGSHKKKKQRNCHTKKGKRSKEGESEKKYDKKKKEEMIWQTEKTK
jgi:hypothetical protein